MPYDKQVIVQVDMDEAGGKNRVALEARAVLKSQNTQSVRVCPREKSEGEYAFSPSMGKTLRAALKGLGPDSRLYLVGHGDWESQKVGYLSGPTMAKFLFAYGLRHARVISIVACEAGRDLQKRTLPSRSQQGLLATSANSFASKFHYALNVTHDLNIDVVARTREVAALPSGYGKHVGRLVSPDDDGIVKHWLDGSKVRFTMKGGKQVRETVEFKEKDGLQKNDSADLLEILGSM
jgi:hypothetical protein